MGSAIRRGSIHGRRGGTNPLVVEQLTRNAVNAALTAYADQEQFPTTFESRVPIDQLKQYIAIAQRYHDATTDVLDRVVIGCRWQNSAHERIWTDAITALAEPRPLNQTVRSRLRNPAGGEALVMSGRDERLEALSLLPATRRPRRPCMSPRCRSSRSRMAPARGRTPRTDPRFVRVLLWIGVFERLSDPARRWR